ncbi:MAG: hypothetical protein M3295_02595 [Chloroflexota bacterium]|nr:hypothetical protein [Chloroflexota bacterium]
MFLLKLGRRREPGSATTEPAWPAVSMEPVEIFTTETRVTGWFSTGGARLTDLLNERTEIRIWRPVSTGFGGEEADGGASGGEWLALRTADIVLAMPPDRAANRQVQVHKWARRATLSMGPFQITGSAHVPPGAEVSAYLVRLQQRFVPLTNVTIVHRDQTESELTADVAIVNATLVHSVVDPD